MSKALFSHYFAMQKTLKWTPEEKIQSFKHMIAHNPHVYLFNLNLQKDFTKSE